MASLGRLNALGQMRVDVPHLRMIESGVARDFDVLAGQMMAGERPLVVSGLTVLSTGMIGAAATSLMVSVAGALFMHYGATDNGTLFQIPSDQAQEQLEPGNARLIGSWVASAVNYVGLDLQMSADSTTADAVKFLDPDTDSEVPRTVPLRRTQGYKFVLSTLPFSSRTTILPLAKVTLDSAGAITAIVDAREMFFRLGAGGDAPDQNPYSWPQAREEEFGGDPFAGGDKGIPDLKSWADAVMTRLWEQGGGPNWYSATADRNVTMIWTGATFTNGENFEWDGTNLHWKGLTFLFDNTPGYYNEVTDVTVDTPGTTNLADGECIYVDLDRTQNLTGGGALTAVKAVMADLGPGTVPGARWIIAWRKGTEIYTRNWRYAVGTTFTPATTTSLGVVELNQTPASAGNPKVVAIMADDRAEVQATANDANAITGRAHGKGAGIVGYGGVPHGTGFDPSEAGTVGYGSAGVGGGLSIMKFGRTGTYGKGGTGIIGGIGTWGLGGNGDAAIDANSGGGAGAYGNGGNGVGVGAGGAGSTALGGVDGTNTVRAPSFNAVASSSGPLALLAFKSDEGGASIPIVNTYGFNAVKTGTVILTAADFTAENLTGTFIPLFFTEGANFLPGYGSRAAGLSKISATVRLPRGATITGAYIYTLNNGVVAKNTTVTIKRINMLGGYGAAVTATNVYNAVAVNTPGPGGNQWFTVGAPAAAQAGMGDGTVSDTVHWVKIQLDQTTADFDLAFQAIQIIYTYQTVDFVV